MRTIFYNIISFVAIVTGVFLLGCFFVGVYQLYLYNKWFLLFLPFLVAIFVKSLRYLSSHVIQPRRDVDSRKKRDDKDDKLLRKLISNRNSN